MKDKQRKKTVSIRTILKRIDDAHDVNRLYQLIMATFRSHCDKGVPYRVLLGDDYAHFPSVPDTTASEHLVRNLITLRVIHMQPADIIALLTGEAGQETLDRVIDGFRSSYELQHRVTGFMIDRAETVRRRLEEEGLRTAIFTDLFPDEERKRPEKRQASKAGPAVAVSPAPALHSLAQMTELENQGLETPDARAEYAVHLFEIGSHDQAEAFVADILKEDPWHGTANYVAAMLHSIQAASKSRLADQRAFTAEITSSDGEGFVSDALEQEAMQLEGEATYHREQALVECLIALHHWPEHGGYFDHSRRRESVLRFCIEGFARQVRGRGRNGGQVIRNPLPPPRHASGPAADLDRWVLDMLKVSEPDRHGVGFGSRPSESLYWLDLYEVLDPAEYDRFAPVWLEQLDPCCSRDELERLAADPAFLRHLRRIKPSLHECREWLRTLEKRCHRSVARTWSDTTMNLLKNEMVGCYAKGHLEQALPSAKERAAAIPSRYRGAAVYDHVRVLYDLSLRAWEAGNVGTAARHLREIAESYPRLLDKLRRCGNGGLKGYLEEVDEDYRDYKDSFGNEDDIVFGADECGEPVAAESTPLASLLTCVIGDGRVTEEDRAVLAAFRGQWARNED